MAQTLNTLGMIVVLFLAVGGASDMSQSRFSELNAQFDQLIPFLETLSPDIESDPGVSVAFAEGGGRRLVKISRTARAEQPYVGRRSTHDTFFWTVDKREKKFVVFFLTGTDADVDRIMSFRKRRGIDSESLEALRERIARFRQHVARQQKPSPPLTAVPESAAYTPLAPGPAPAFEETLVCTGYGSVSRTVEDPVGIDCNVTTVTASWSRLGNSPKTILGFAPGKNCWHKDAAGYLPPADTQWYTDSCTGPTNTVLSTSFDTQVVGTYHNDDFALGIFGRTTVWAQAAANLTAVAGFNYSTFSIEEGSAVPTWFLSGFGSGGSSEDCHMKGNSCNVDEQTIHDCEHPQDYYYWDEDTCEGVAGASPIVVDFGQQGLDLTDASSGVLFDVLATGTPVQVAWTQRSSLDAFLVLDRNGNGLIDNGGELFGNFTEQPEQRRKNGFRALAVFDEPSMGGCPDGKITSADAVFSALRLWTDRNHDGVSQSAELAPLVAAGVTEVSLDYRLTKRRDEYGNLYRFTGHVQVDANPLAPPPPVNRAAIDVFFNGNNILDSPIITR